MTSDQPDGEAAVAWGQVLNEAREIRNKQDARLANAQRQSQLIVAGFLAMTAIFVTGVSVALAYRPGAIDGANIELELGLLAIAAFVAVAALNGVIWVNTHTVARHWEEIAEFDVLTRFPGSVDALARILDAAHLGVTVTGVDLRSQRQDREMRFPSTDVSRGLIFDFGLPSAWRRMLEIFKRPRRRGHARNLASG